MKPLIHFLLLIFTITQTAQVIAQKTTPHQVLQGNIYSQNEQIMFATIGVVGENVGTISDQYGNFELSIPERLFDKNLTISHIGYGQLTLPLDSLLKLTKVKIQLIEETTYLNEVIVVSEKLKGKTFELGNKHQHDFFLWIQNGTKGSEIATLMTPNKEIFLNSVSVHINNKSEEDFTLLVNIYEQDLETGLPGRQLLRKLRIVNSNQKSGWLEVSLSDQNLLIAKPFFVSFQWVDVKKSIPLIGAKTKTSQKSLIRISSLGTWGKFVEWDIKANCTAYKGS